MSDDTEFNELWAWVTEDHEGRITLIGAALPGLGHQPLLSHNKEIVLMVQHIAEAHGSALQQPVWLRRYVLSEEIGRITAKLRMRN